MSCYLLAALSSLQPIAWLLLVIFGCLGALAVVSPRRFGRVAGEGGRWIDSTRWLAWLDKRYDIDKFVLPFSRLLGALVIASVIVLGWLLSQF